MCASGDASIEIWAYGVALGGTQMQGAWLHEEAWQRCWVDEQPAEYTCRSIRRAQYSKWYHNLQLGGSSD